MLRDVELSDFINFIKFNFPQKSIEVVDALELVELVFDDIYDLIGDKVKNYVNLQEIEEAADLLRMSKKVLDIKRDLEDTKELFIDENEEENKIEEELIEDGFEDSPDYSKCIVDNTVPHTLYEDFTHTKPCAFELEGVKYKAWNMRDVLVRLCEILASEDPEKMKSLITDPTMKGRKIAYFSGEQISEKDKNKSIKLSNLDVYVWVNLSCTQIRNVIRRLLTKFKINLTDFKIYLRADYNNLHINKNNTILEKEDSQEKIGQHVRSCFKQLENYPFTENEMNAMQSSDWTLQSFGFSTPMIKKYDPFQEISDQIKIRGSNRYWVDRFKILGKEYFVVCQWQKIHREKFDNWFNSLNKVKGAF